MSENLLLSLPFILIAFLIGSFWVASGLRLASYFYGSYHQRHQPFSRLWLRRSHCDHCNNQLPVSDLIPFFSFFLLRGRCRYCGKSISPLYPLLEWGSAMLVMAGFLLWFDNRISAWQLFWLFAVTTVLIWLAIIDGKKLHVPNSLIFALLLIAFPVWIQNFLLSPETATLHLERRGFGALFGLIFLLLYWFSPRKLGFADVKFIFAIGLFLTLQEMVWIILISSLLAIVVSWIVSMQRNLSIRKIRLPYISCLVLALSLYFLYYVLHRFFIL